MTSKPSVDTLIQEAQVAEQEGRRSDARVLFEQALYSLKRSQDGQLATSILRWVARTHQSDGDPDAALDCLDASIEIATLAGDAGAIGQAMNAQATVHGQLGDLDQAESLNLEARTRALAAGDTRLAAMTALDLGVIAQIRGDHETTLRYFRMSLGEFRSVGAPKEVLATLNRLGKLFAELERWDEGVRAFDEAAQIADAIGDRQMRITLEVNRAELEILRGDLAAARAACELATSLSYQTHDTFALGEIARHLGAIAREAGELQSADAHFERAHQIGQQQNNSLLLAETARERAELTRRQGRHRDALTHLNRGHRILTQMRAGRSLADVDYRTARLERLFLEVVRHWSGSIESKDRYTQGHCERVADLACALALRAGMEARQLFWFRIGAIVHDVGKLIVPSELLNKPGRLAPDEWELVKRHPSAGVEMLSDMNFPADLMPMVRHHHERWDGQGYPEALSGEAIPVAARMLCIADVYDALTARRSYKGALTHDAAMEIMRADIGAQFDPALFTLFEDMMKTRAQSFKPRITIESKTGDRPTVRDLTVTGPNDDLTGVLTRRPFVELANKILAERGPFATVSLIVIDVDEFKHVNDTHGHLQGDAVLRVVAGTLRELAAATGVVARYAGDEFVILLPHTPLNEAAELAERIRSTVGSSAIPLRERSGSISVSLSIGVVGARPEHADFDRLFEAADRALYEAKRRGRDTVVLATDAEEPSLEPTINLQQHFVGREEEWDTLTRLLESAVQRGPYLAFVVGEAGVGKSTLVRRLTSEVRLCAGKLVTGRCVEADAKPPFAPWAEAIQQLGPARPEDKPEFAQLMKLLTEPRSESKTTKYVLFNEVIAFLRLSASVRPIVIVLEDLQWADNNTWDVLEHVMSQLDFDRILVCVTMRTEDTRGEALERRNRLLRDERFREITLPRLTEAQIQQWLVSVFGNEASRELLSYLLRYSEGNPLLATQLLRMLLDDHALRYEQGRWGLRSEQRDHALPSVLTGIMERRLDRLAPSTRKILNTAAVIGRVFDIDVAMAAGAGSEDEALDAIDECIAHAVLEPSKDTSGTHFSFTHRLLVDAVHRAINPRRLARIHERVAEAMETHTPDNAAEIALHYDRSGSASKAFPHAMRAGGSALLIYAHAEARQFFEIAERAASNPVERAQALQRLAEVAESEGRYTLTEELCDRALAGLVGSTEAKAIIGLRRMREGTRALQGQAPKQTIMVCSELVAMARQLGDRHEEAALLNMISQYQGMLGEWRDAEETAREAVSAAESAGDDRLLAEAFTRLGSSMMERQSPEAGDFYHRALSLFHDVGDRCGEARCYINIGSIQQSAGDVIAAEVAFDRALESSERAHALDLAGLASLKLGVLYQRRGQLEAANERYEEALERFTESSNEPQRLTTLYNMAQAARERDDWSAASNLYEQVVAVAARTGQPDIELGARAGQALAALAVGARSVADDAMRWIRSNVEPRPEWWFQGRDLVDALRIRLAAERGDDAHAMRLLHEAVAIAGRYDPYVAAFLVAESAPSLRRSTDALVTMIDQISPEVDNLGFAAVAERLSVLRVALAGATQAA